MMNVWIVNPFDNLPLEGLRPQRYWLMARAFVRAGNHVVYWTSDFSHATKEKRKFERSEGFNEAEGIEVRLIPTLPYPKNICLARLKSHHQLARDFTHLARLETLSPPSLIISSTPPLGLCEAARRVAGDGGAVFVADVQDAWPETFERILPRFVWTLLGWRRSARRIYREADGISAVAQRYLDLARSYGSTAPMLLAGHAVEMTALAQHPPVHSPCRLAYIGNMSLSYDLTTLLEAVRDLNDVTLDIAGNGPDRERLMKRNAADNIRFHGYLGTADLERLLANSDIGIIPMFPESCVGVPGKLADYAKAGLRVIESLGGECQALVERFGVGCHYRSRDVNDLKSAIRKMISGTSASEDGLRAFRAHFDAERVMTDYVAWTHDLLRARTKEVR